VARQRCSTLCGRW